MTQPVASKTVSPRLIIGAIFLAVVLLAVKFTPVYTYLSLNQIIRAVQIAQHNRVWAWTFYAFFVVGVMALPITMFPIVGGVLFPFWIALPLNVMAATAGGWLAFLF